MKTSIATICLLFSAVVMNAQDTISGIWNMGKEMAQIEIMEDNQVYSGKIIASDNPKVKVGKQLLKNVSLVDGEWKGKMYAPKRGKWYDAVLKEENGKLMVTVDAGLISKTLEWTKEKN